MELIERRYSLIKWKWKKMGQEQKLLLFFAILLIILLIRLFYLQIVQGSYWKDVLLSQHYTKSDLVAKRGHIYTTDKGGKRIQLTNNVEYFTLYVDPKFVRNKERVLEELTPIVYSHFCEMYGLETIDKKGCIENVESFTKTEILPKREGVFVTVTTGDSQYYVESEEVDNEINEIVAAFTDEQVYSLIYDKLEDALKGGIKEKNYLGFYDNEHFLDAIQKLPYVDVVDQFYVYVVPERVTDHARSATTVNNILKKYGFYDDDNRIKQLFSPQEIRYVRIINNANAKIAKRIKDAKVEFYNEKTDGIPLLHGFGLEEYEKRYYPHETFMSHIVGYLDREGVPFYGIEQYFDEQLAGKDGKIIGLATPWIGQVGANSFEIAQPEDGMDIYLTIDPVIQKETENWVRHYRNWLIADAIAVTILDPHTGKVKAMVNAPTFNSNAPEIHYKLRPMRYDERYLVEVPTYIDYPVFVLSGEELRQAVLEERNDPAYKKYIFDQYVGPQVFIDKNIALPYEPGSIFKALTLGIAIDSDAVSMFDFYTDPGFVKIGQYIIANISQVCKGDHTYLHALEYSCNVGMVRLAQSMTKYVFYSYLKKLGFGEPTDIELAGENAGTLPDFNFVSKARFFNNTYGQGLLTTPLQMAVGYAAAVNGGIHIKPTIVEAIYDPNKENYIKLGKKSQKKVFKSSTSNDIKEALVSVIDNGNLKEVAKPGYSVGGKTGTSEIAFKGRYKGGHGWTNGSFVGMVTSHDTKYVIAVQVRRPRSSPWGLDTAGRVFSSLADFLLSYEKIEK